MLKNMKIGTKILIAFTTVAILAVGLVGFFAFTIGSSTMEAESFNKLTAVREMKADQIEDYFKLIENQVITLSEDRMIIDAMREFDDGLHAVEVDLGITETEMQEIDARLESYYEEEFLPRLIPNMLEDVSVEDFWPEDSRTRVLQDLYIAYNPFDVGSKHLLDNAGDGSSYSQTHEIYHPIIRDFLEKFGYYDIFLVDVDTGGHIAYSVFKEVDFGTSLLNGPYSDTNFAAAYNAAREAGDRDFVKVVDFEPYAPSYNAPAAFIASPIFDGDEKIGVLVFQFPIDRINAVMTSNQNWSAVGLGESGETYIVGDDFLLRNQSRFLIEDSENYFKLIEEIGTPLTTIARIRNFNSTIGLQEVQTEGTQAALSGETGTAIFPDYRGVPVLSSYKPLDVRDVNWVIMSEIDQAEAFAPVRALGIQTLIGVLVLIAVIVIMAVLFSRTITRPLDQLTQTADELAKGNLDVEVACKGQEDEIGTLACSFDTMRVSMKGLIGDLEDINQNLENLVEERTKELELSELRSRSIIESAGEGIIVIDKDGNIILWNQSAENMFGYTAEEMIGHSMSQMVPEKFLDGHIAASQRAMETGQLAHPGITHELTAIRKDGSEFPMELTLAIWSIAGETYVSGVLRDVTERREAEERIRTIVEIAPDAVITIDAKQTITLFNPKAEEIFGYAAEDVLGQPLTMLMPENSRGIHAGEVEKFSHESLSARNMDNRREILGRRQDGSVFPAEAGISKMMINGEQYFTTFFRDITDRKLAEQTIRDREERLSAFTTALPDLAFILDEDGRYEAILSSQDEQLVLSKDEMLGRVLHDLLPLELADKLLATIKSALDTGDTQLIEYTLEVPAGLLWFEGRCAPITESLGDKQLAVLLVRDITERKQLEAQILQQKEMLENTIESLTHPFYVIDADDYSILLANSAAKELGVSGETKCYALTHRRDTPCDSLEDPCPLVEVKKRKEPFTVEHIHFDKEGNSRYAEVHGYPIFDADGNVIQMIEYSFDITDRKKMEAQLELANERMSEELNFARDIQMGLLPLIFPAFPTRNEFSIFASLIPAREVGGDFYDFYFLDEYHLCFVVGDVSGKGAPGALLMAVSKTLIKSRAMDDFSPSSILTHVNNELSQNNDAAMFVTVFLGIMDIRTGKIEYTNAGHNPPYIKRKDNMVEKLGEFHGPVIGALPGLHYKESDTTLERDDIIVVYTDGVTEAMNIQDELYSDARLEEFLAADNLNMPQKLCDQVVRDVKRHEGEAEQSDDITILALEFTAQTTMEEIGRLGLKIKNQIKELAFVEEKFEAFCQEHGISDLTRQQVSMVLDEMLNNVVNYAYRDEDEHIIDVEFVLSGNRLRITMRDDGVPFNPFALDPPNIAMTLDEREIGGLGIYLVRSVMDEYMYTRHIGRNVVNLVKLIKEE